MKGRRAPRDGDQFATNLRETLDRQGRGKRLTWDGRGESLVVQTPYGQEANIDQICEGLASIPIEIFRNGEYQRLRTNTWIRYMTAVESIAGCPLHGEASRYTVFSCRTDEDVCTIYELDVQTMQSPICDVPLNVAVSIEQEIIEEQRFFSLFRGPRQIEYGYSITFILDDVSAYHGGLVYEMDRQERAGQNMLTIPVTRGMVEKKKIYIKSGSLKPRVRSTMKGLCVKVTQKP